MFFINGDIDDWPYIDQECQAISVIAQLCMTQSEELHCASIHRFSVYNLLMAGIATTVHTDSVSSACCGTDAVVFGNSRRIWRLFGKELC